MSARPFTMEKSKHMKLAMRRIKVYFKLGVVITVALLILLLVIMNKDNTADIWFFGSIEDVNVLYLILITAVASVLCWWGATKISKLIREFKAVRQAEKARMQAGEEERRRQELAERERRLDEKMRQSLSE